MREHVSEFAAFMDRARGRNTDVTWYAAGGRKLTKESPQTGRILSDVRVVLRVRSLEIHVRHQRRPSMSRTSEVDHIDIVRTDQTIQVHVDEAQTRRSTPVT